MKTLKIMAMIAVLTVYAAGPAAAQAVAPIQDKSQKAATAEPKKVKKKVEARVDNAKVNAYVKAVIRIQEMYTELSPEIKAADTEEEKTAMLGKIKKNIAGIVESTENLTIDEYNLISEAAKQNAQLENAINASIAAQLQPAAAADGQDGAESTEGARKTGAGNQ